MSPLLTKFCQRSVQGTDSLSLHDVASESILGQSLLQFNTPPVHHIIPLLNLSSHSHPSEVKHLRRFLPLLLQPLHSDKANTYKTLLLRHRIQFSPLIR
ncbi:MAG: hypothetical protein SO468_02300 [Prevotella sp.]|nr:hypothetical protein [Prevotella sp.]